MQKPFVLIVEDETDIAELIAINLKHNGFDCAIANNSTEAQAIVYERPTDLVLLDWMLPNMSGMALAKLWRSQKETRNLPIIMVTAKADEIDKVSGLDAGVDDYLTKPFSTKELIARVRAVLRRRAPGLIEQSTLIKVGMIELDTEAHSVMVEGIEVPMSLTEFKVLHALLLQVNKVMSRELLQIAVWGRYSDVDTRTVDVHIKRLREALTAVSPQAALQISTVRGVGYKMTPHVE